MPVIRADDGIEVDRRQRRPTREQERDPCAAHAPGRETEGIATRSVAPLQVVDGDHQRAIARHRPKHIGDGHADQAGIRRFAPAAVAALAAAERGVQGAAPWRCQRTNGGFGGRIVEQGSQDDEREVALGFAGSPGEDSVAAFLGPADAIDPQRRLPDARLALDEQHRRPRGLEPLPDPRPLLVATDDLGVALTRDPGFPWFHGCLRPRLPRSSDRPASNQGYHDEDVGPE